MLAVEETVFIVDDDDAIRVAMELLMQSAGLVARTFPSGRDFLQQCTPDMRGCVLLDVNMPDMDGLALQQQLQQSGIDMPVIFLTGHGDVPIAVSALKKGALDFFQKPVDDEQLLIDKVHEALQLHRELRNRSREHEQIREKLSRLTPRELEVATQVATGKSNKVIALDFGISERTVELHRGRAMQKLNVRSVADLVRILVN